jgi:hypothetical protein
VRDEAIRIARVTLQRERSVMPSEQRRTPIPRNEGNEIPSRFPKVRCGRLPWGILCLLALLAALRSPSAEGQIFDRLRQGAEEALDRTTVLQRLLEEPPGITTSIRDAHTEVPFLDDHDPSRMALMAALPRTEENAFYAPPGLYEMEALSYCIHAGTYGPTGGDGYALAPLRGDLAPVLESLMRSSVDHPELSQDEIQSLIWALQSRAPLGELSPELQGVARTLLEPAQLEQVSEGVVDRASEALMEEALDRVPSPVRRVAEVQADLRELLRRGADFQELEAVAVLTGIPSPAEQVRAVPRGRWSYHPGGYFIRFDPEGYTLTRVQAYVPEIYQWARDRKGRLEAVEGPRGLEMIFEYGRGLSSERDDLAQLTGVRLARWGKIRGEWAVDGWVFVGNDLSGRPPGGTIGEADWDARRQSARDLRRQIRDVISWARGSDAGRPGRDLTDLSHLRKGLLEAQGTLPREVLIHLGNAWQYALCLEAGGCPGPRAGRAQLPEEARAEPTLHGPAVRSYLDLIPPAPGTPLFREGGGTRIDAGGNVAAPGNTGSQRLLQSGRSPKDKVDLAMKAMSVFLALADVLGSSGLGSAAYNALGMFGLPVGHLGLSTMMAGAMISEVVGMWSDATDALAGDTGDGGGGGEAGGSGGSSGGEGGSGGGEGGGGGDQGGSGGDEGGGAEGPGGDPSSHDPPSDLEGWEDTRSDGQDYQETPPSNPPPHPTPPPSGSEVSSGRAEAYELFSGSLLGTLYHMQSLMDSELRQEAARRAGDLEWARTQAELALEHQRAAALGMLELAGALENLLDLAEAEGVLESAYADAESLAGIQERLRSEGWSEEEMRMAALLRITPGEMEVLREYMVAQDPEVMSGELGEAARLWAREMRTAGILWMALLPPEPSLTPSP